MDGGGKAGRAVWYRSSEGGGGEILAHGGQALVTDARWDWEGEDTFICLGS